MTSVAVARVPMPISVAGISQQTYDLLQSFRDDLEANLPAIEAVLPKGVRAESLASVALATCVDNPKLLECSALSLFRAVYKAATLNLRIGETCDIVPKGGKAECWTRVKGVVELATRAGSIQWARVGEVCEGDTFEYEETETGTKFRHVPRGVPARNGSNVTHIYARLTLPSGSVVFEVWPMEKCLAHKARYAPNPKPGSAWADHTLAMMSKSVVKSALRYARLSPMVLSAIESGDESDEVPSLPNPEESLQLAAGSMDAMENMDEALPEVVALDDRQPTTPQVGLLEKMLRSHVWSDEERAKITAGASKSRKRMTDALEYVQSEMKKRKAAEKADDAEVVDVEVIDDAA